MEAIKVENFRHAWVYVIQARGRSGYFYDWPGNTYIVDAPSEREAKKILRRNWVTTAWRLETLKSWRR